MTDKIIENNSALERGLAEEKSKAGKRNRRKGSEFEKRVRDNLRDAGWLVFKNDNQVWLDKDPIEFDKAKMSWNPFRKSLVVGAGFPDFVCIGMAKFGVKFVEAKLHGLTSHEEKIKAAWIKENLKIPIFVAFLDKNDNLTYKEL